MQQWTVNLAVLPIIKHQPSCERIAEPLQLPKIRVLKPERTSKNAHISLCKLLSHPSSKKQKIPGATGWPITTYLLRSVLVGVKKFAAPPGSSWPVLHFLRGANHLALAGAGSPGTIRGAALCTSLAGAGWWSIDRQCRILPTKHRDVQIATRQQGYNQYQPREISWAYIFRAAICLSLESGLMEARKSNTKSTRTWDHQKQR